MTKIDEFDKAYKTAKLVQNELKELLYVSVQSLKVIPKVPKALNVPNTSDESSPIRYIVTDMEDEQATYGQNNIQDETSNNEDVKLEIEILDDEDNFDEAYNYDMDERIECLEEYEIIQEEQEDLGQEYFESHLSDTEEVLDEVHLRANDFDFGDCVTMTCDLCNTNFKR